MNGAAAVQVVFSGKNIVLKIKLNQIKFNTISNSTVRLMPGCATLTHTSTALTNQKKTERKTDCRHKSPIERINSRM